MKMDMSPTTTTTTTNSSSSSATEMAALFFQSTSTPLFVSALTPQTSAQYIGTLFFLLVLGVLLRVLLALRPVLEATVWSARLLRPRPQREKQQQQQGRGLEGQGQRVHGDGGEGSLLDSELDLEVEQGEIEVVRRNNISAGPSSVWREARYRWRGTTVLKSLGRAGYEVLLAGIGYLLMLAVMTMNVGYFLAVLLGVFVGTFMLGNLAGMASGDGDDGQTQHC